MWHLTLISNPVPVTPQPPSPLPKEKNCCQHYPDTVFYFKLGDHHHCSNHSFTGFRLIPLTIELFWSKNSALNLPFFQIFFPILRHVSVLYLSLVNIFVLSALVLMIVCFPLYPPRMTRMTLSFSGVGWGEVGVFWLLLLQRKINSGTVVCSRSYV